ncbi:putative survival protein SurE-like phosphatase/nucleotidase [Helianthus anomalus]
MLRFVENLYTVCRDKSFAGHSFTYQESISVSTAEIEGATAYEVTGTPVDSVSYGMFLVFGGDNVIVGVNKGPSCGHDM